jgi:hypothetical protein
MSQLFMEMRDQFEVVLNQSQRSITRKFFEFDNEPGYNPSYAVNTLPALGDNITDWTPLPWFNGLNMANEFVNCHVSDIKATPFKRLTKPVYVITYSIDPPAFTLHNETLRIGYEYVMVQMATASGSTNYIGMDTPTLFDGTMRKLITNADYTYTDYFDTLADATRFLVNGHMYFIADFDGTVLAECFIENIPMTPYGLYEDTHSHYYKLTAGAWPPAGQKAIDGNWLMNGCDITYYTDKTGQQKFMRTESYKYKRVQKGSSKIGVINNNDCLTTGWNMVFNRFTGTWELTDPTTFALTTTAWPRLMPDLNGYWFAQGDPTA